MTLQEVRTLLRKYDALETEFNCLASDSYDQPRWIREMFQGALLEQKEIILRCLKRHGIVDEEV